MDCQSKMDVSKQVTKRTWNSIHKYGATICSNGWDKCCMTSIVEHNACSSPSDDVFIGSIDITREWKDAHYICNMLVGYIETIGVDNIAQICTNNVSNMRSVADLLIFHFPSLYFQGYVFHCVILLLENWGITTWVKQFVKKAKIVFFI